MAELRDDEDAHDPFDSTPLPQWGKGRNGETVALCRISPIDDRSVVQGTIGHRLNDWIEPVQTLPIVLPRAAITEFCRRHRIRRLALFGSVLRSDFRPDSDVDVLIEFIPEYIPGLAFFAMQDELSRLLGRQVDLNTPKDLSRYFRDQVLSEAEPVYVEA